MTGLIGKKAGMTHIFDDRGDQIPVTVLELGPCPVAQVKTKQNDGYDAVQLAFEPLVKKDKRKLSRPQGGHFEKNKLPPHRFLREIRLKPGAQAPKVGDNVTVDTLKDALYVSVIAVSKGRGYQGVIKRHGFAGFPASRGTHEFFRHGGSIGNRDVPGRVFPNKRMAGHMGDVTVKTLNLEVVKTFPEQNLLLVRGAVPGPNGGLVIVERSDRRRKRVTQHVAEDVADQKKAKTASKTKK